MENSSVTEDRLPGKSSESENGTAEGKVKGVGQECPTHAGIAALPDIAPKKYGWLSRLRSYFFFDPLIWFYTVAFGLVSIPFGFFDKDGSILHGFASAWAKVT